MTTTYMDVGNPAASNLVTLATTTSTSPQFTNLTTLTANPQDNRYSFVEDGTAEETDHVLVSSDLAPTASISYARFGADFPLVDINDDTTALHASSHDGVIAYLAIPYTPQFTLTSSLNPSAYGQNVTFTASLRGTAGEPAGTVTFYDGSTTLCNGVQVKGSAATCSSSTLSIGSHSIKAAYSGSSTYQPATASLVQIVAPAASSLQLTTSPNPSYFGQVVTLAVAATSTGPTPQGTITFKDLTTGANLGTATLAAGSASLHIGTLAVGSHVIQAYYAGDTTDSASNSNQVTQVVLSSVQQSTLTCAPDPAPYGTTVTCTDSLTALGGTPVGTVTFNDGSTPLRTTQLVNGTAAFSTSTLSVGVHPIVAVFPGSSNATPSTSNTVQEIILPVFSLAVSPSSQTVYAGVAASYIVSVIGGAGFTLNVAFSCSNAPPGGSCSVTPETVGPNGTAKLVVQTSAPAKASVPAQSTGRKALPLAAALLILLVPRRFTRRRGKTIFLFLLIAAALGTISACGGSGTLSGGTPPATYSITVSGSALNSPAPVVKTATASLNVRSLF